MKTRVLCSSIFYSQSETENKRGRDEKVSSRFSFPSLPPFSFKDAGTNLHGRLSSERVDDGPVLVHSGSVRNRLPGVLGSSGESEGLGSVEGNRGSDLSVGGGGGTLEGSLLGGLSLDIGGGGCRRRERREVVGGKGKGKGGEGEKRKVSVLVPFLTSDSRARREVWVSVSGMGW